MDMKPRPVPSWVLGGFLFIVLLGPGALFTLTKNSGMQSIGGTTAAAAVDAWSGYVMTINIAGQLQAGVYEAVLGGVFERPAPLPPVELEAQYVPAR